MITHGRGYLFGVTDDEEYPVGEGHDMTLVVTEEGSDLDE